MPETFTAYPATPGIPWTTFEIEVDDKGWASVAYTSGPEAPEMVRKEVLSGACYLARTTGAVSTTLACGFIVVAAGRF